MKPTVGRIVHYVSYGTPGGEYGRECRAAVVTQVGGVPPDRVALCVMNPAGLFFNEAVECDEGVSMTLPAAGATETATGHAVLCGAQSYKGGTWHWPAREPGDRPAGH